MTDVMTQQLVQSLKGYYKKEEFSDKILHIIEIDEYFGKRKITCPGKIYFFIFISSNNSLVVTVFRSVQVNVRLLISID